MIDKHGRTWTPEVDVVTVGRVRKELDVNILELLVPNNTLLDKLSDCCLLVDVLFLLCEDQAKAAGITDVDFGKSMTGDSIDAGLKETMQGIVNFSPSAIRPAHQKVLDKAIELERARAKRLQEMIQNPELDAMLETAMTQGNSPTPGSGVATNLQESSESSPEETPSLP